MPPARLAFLDVFRGVALIVMVLNHTGRWWIAREMGWGRYWLVYGTVTVAAPGFETRSQPLEVPAGGTVDARRIWLHRTAVGDLQATVPGDKPVDAPTRVSPPTGAVVRRP